MVFPDTVEQLKNQYTDKYVKVDGRRPELSRFAGAVGQVKTVNMNGRALVQFLDYHLNTGWYDIDLGCLTVVDKPSEDLTAKPEAKRSHDVPAGKAAPTAGDKQVADAKAPAGGGGEKKLSPLEMARMQGAGGASAAKPSGGAAAPAKKSTADILAAARGKTSAPAAAAAPTPAPPAAKAPTPPPTPAPTTPAAASGDAVRVDKSAMTVAQMVEYCRAKDAG